jgi:hypothetical protein
MQILTGSRLNLTAGLITSMRVDCLHIPKHAGVVASGSPFRNSPPLVVG